ncbi:MAG: hypothetical protein K8J08_09760 [Thermoanaerobaculia bacterium]|nr:hypothetical protein [Thermoanaerobaculia bacterium]
MRSTNPVTSTLSFLLLTSLALTGTSFANDESTAKPGPVDEVLTHMICLGERVVQGSKVLAEESPELADLQARTHQEMVEYIQAHGYETDVEVEMAYRNHQDRPRVRESILKSTEKTCQPGPRVLEYLDYMESEDYGAQ